jgi:hypothetical protein
MPHFRDSTMKRHLFYLVTLFTAFIGLMGCAEKQDFNQYDDLAITPVLEASILYLESPESFINQAPAALYHTETFNFDAFAEQFISENVLDGLLTYELDNTTSKELEITVEFLDAGGNVLDTEIFLIEPGPTSSLRREIAYGGVSGRSIDILRNTSAIRLSGRNLGDTSSVSSQSDPVIIFRSSAQIRIRLK